MLTQNLEMFETRRMDNELKKNALSGFIIFHSTVAEKVTNSKNLLPKCFGIFSILWFVLMYSCGK